MIRSSTNEIADIFSIEKELQTLLESEGVKWQRIAHLLLMVQTRELYKSVVPTFTAWVKKKSSEFNIHESNLWRILNAGKYYLSIEQSAGLGDMMQTKATAEQLELVKKINSVAPEAITQNLLEKIKLGELNRQELRATWQIYRPVKEGQTERGRKPAGGRYSAKAGSYFSEDFSIYDLPSESVVVEQEQLLLTEANLIEALHQDRTWPLEKQDLEAESGEILTGSVSEIFRNVALPQSRQLEVVVLKKGHQQLSEPIVYGVKAVSQKIFIEKNQDLDEYLPFCHYLYVVIADNKYVLKSAMVHYGQEIGILSVNERLQICVQRKALKRQPECIGITYGCLLNSLIKWYNY